MEIGSLHWWGIQLSINLLDFVMIYMIAYAVLKQKINVGSSDILIGITYALFAGVTGYYLDGYAVRLIIIPLLLFSTSLTIKKRDLSSILIIYIIFFILVGIMQGFILINMILLGWSQEVTFFISQILTTGAIAFLCKNLKLHQWFYALQINVVLKLTLFIVFLIIIIVAFFTNYENHIPYYLFFSIAVVLVGLVLVPILMTLYYKVIGMISVHDLHNSMLSLGLIINDIDDPQVIKDKFKIHAKEFGMDLSQLDFTHIQDVREYGEKMENKIELFIETKQASYHKEIEIDIELFYYKDCEKFGEPQLVLKWLGMMLDNALEASDTHPIFIFLTSTHKSFTLKMTNEYTGTKEEVNQIFEKGYSTKGESRGFGLYNLNQQVIELGGDIDVDVYDDNNRNCQFIEISIEFKKEDAN